MADGEHLKILRNGIDAWERWRKEHTETADFEGADLRNLELSCADLSRANLCRADLSEANLYGTNLRSANLQGTNLRNATLHHVIFRGANLSGANFIKAMLRGVDFFETNLSRTDFSEATLIDPILTRANLRSAILIRTFFVGGTLDVAELQRADLTDATLSGVELSRSSFEGADLSRSDLMDANLHGADLSHANLDNAHLSGANFQKAIALSTKFADCDLSEAIGLDLVRHPGPSTIGIDTIYRSKGAIPENFLRGCGVPEGFITQMHSLVDAVDGIQFYSCFISYSSKDDEFARRLHGRMRDAHLRVWFAPEEMKGGNLLIEQIETAIRVYDKLLIVLSEASLQSEWVMTELRRARKAERQSGKRKLFPVRLVDFETLRNWECFDADSGKDLAVELREYFIPDFSNWKDHDQFEAAFARLLKDLRAEERAR